MELNLDSNIYNKKVQTTETEPAIQNITDNKIWLGLIPFVKSTGLATVNQARSGGLA